MKNTVKAIGQKIAGTLYRNDFPRLIQLGAVQRPHYAYIVYQAANLARRLGISKISVLEFGVAGGRGLLNLEMQAMRVAELTGVGVEVYGFDTGAGLPPPVDHRDLPYIWRENNFKMDQDLLKRRLTTAKLVLGLVKDTVRDFAAKYDPAPLGAVAFDLDYYSSTVDALKILQIEHEKRLPRVFAYFDDLYSSDLGHVGPKQGVPLAISEFNAQHETQSIAQFTHLEFEYRPARAWHRQIYGCADFAHPRFNDYIVGSDRQLPI